MHHLFDVIVCGSLHLDIVVEAPALPQVDETAVGRAWHQVCGGKGGNQAVQASRAGARTAFLGRVGDDEFGRTLKDNLQRSGVDVSGVTVDPNNGSGMSVAISLDDGDYGAVIVSGANLSLDAPTIADHWTRLGGAKVLVLQNEIPHAANVAAAKIARKNGSVVVLNAAPARELGMDLLGNVDVLVINRVEAEALTGEAVGTREEACKAITKLSSSARTVVITLGGNGLVVTEPSNVITEIEPIPVRVTSTHGAGDCFIGAIAAKLAKGVSIVDACREANIQAAAFVSRPPRPS